MCNGVYANTEAWPITTEPVLQYSVAMIGREGRELQAMGVPNIITQEYQIPSLKLQEIVWCRVYCGMRVSTIKVPD